MFVKSYCSSISGIEAVTVAVEVNITAGIGMYLVGLPIAVAMLPASGQIDAAPLSRYVLLGELSLDGSILPVKGALPIAMQALKEGFAGIILPVKPQW